MARNRFDNLEPQRREAILSAAAEEFAARGYAGAALSRIIAAAGISKGSLYYYFNDKQDLFVTTVDVAMQRLLEPLDGFAIEDLASSSYWDALRDVGIRSIASLSQDHWYARLAMAFPRLRAEPEARSAIQPALAASRTFTTRLLARGRELGVVRRDLPLDLLVVVTMATEDASARWLIERRSDYEGEALRRLVEARIDLMRDMLDAKHEGWDG